MGGSLRLGDGPEQGCTFVITLPLWR
ncbi:hypothetical protein [Paenibacillus sonchi]